MTTKITDLAHDPTGRGCALAGRVNDEEMDFTADVCVACMTEKARHAAGMHLGDYGRWWARTPDWIPDVANEDCPVCEDAWYQSQQGA